MPKIEATLELLGGRSCFIALTAKSENFPTSKNLSPKNCGIFHQH